MRSVDIEEIGALGIVARTIFLGRQSFEFLFWGQHISNCRSERERVIEPSKSRQQDSQISVAKPLDTCCTRLQNTWAGAR